MSRSFRWLPHEGRRHAVSARLEVRDEGVTLCGIGLVVPSSPAYPQWCWPTCAGCDLAWREHEGIQPYPRPTGRGLEESGR
ncbi:MULTISPECIES: zinc finger protein [Actinosynnema]|uniref:zinc finger protein n=1 Tax=Actinosynnema TaxID=40566 RepID=UPI0020A569AA|nr:zinc finger protein [Actinosynnema pretiosum]MCP2095821.1 zinc-finger [Actinosynnema pretiosum]